MTPALRARVDLMAMDLCRLQADAAAAQERVKQKRLALGKLVEQYGKISARGRKTKVLLGDKFRVALSNRVEISLDEDVVERMRGVCSPRLFSRLFDKVIFHTLRGDAEKIIRDPEFSGSRRLFAQAILTRAMTPALYVDPIDGDRRQQSREDE